MNLNGLTEEKAKELLAQNGKNELKEAKPKTYLQMFIAQLNEPMIYILLVAMAICLFVREVPDACVMGVVIVLNAVIGVIQEGKAQAALAALKQMSAPLALVRRDGEIKEIPAADLVVGDIVILEAGRQIPADLKLLETANLKIEESALTGESVPVDKDANAVVKSNAGIGDKKNMCFMSTSVTYGRGVGEVMATGMNTEIGKIATMLENTEEDSTPLQKRLADLGKLLGMVAIAVCVALFVVEVFFRGEHITEALIESIALAVAAVPEGLPAIVTIVLALGVRRLAQVSTIVRRLPSVETLGAVSVVCSDKTGTLTQNKMTVKKCYYNGKLFNVEELDMKKHSSLINGFVLCNDATLTTGDPTEIALVQMGEDIKASKEELEKANKRIDELAFDSDRKMMSTLHKTADGNVQYTKGAVDEMLRLTTHILDNDKVREITKKDIESIQKAIKEQSADALRVLGLAMRSGVDKAEEKKLVFVGLVGMIDPPRPEAKTAVETFKTAGVRTIMITGDHKDTAFAIAKELGIADKETQVMEGREIEEIGDNGLDEIIEDLRVFARVSPEHKVKIVQALKRKGHIVSMTGDGVNDAHSLKTADIGVAMGITGTDVAKGAADMVLTDDNFATIEKAIEEGRGIYENIKKSVIFLLSSNFGEIISMFFAILIGLPAPLTAIQILWINLITDSLPGLALGVDVNDSKDIMKRPPRKASESLFANGEFVRTLLYGVLIGGMTILAYLYVPAKAIGSWHFLDIKHALDNNPELLNTARTFAFTTLGVSQLFHAFGMRNVRITLFKHKWFDNGLMIVAFVFGLFLQLLVTEVPFFNDLFRTIKLTGIHWVKLLLWTMLPLLMHEIYLPFNKKLET